MRTAIFVTLTAFLGPWVRHNSRSLDVVPRSCMQAVACVTRGPTNLLYLFLVFAIRSRDFDIST